MKRVGTGWAALTGGERLLMSAVVLSICVTLVLAAVGIAKRPADISNPDAAFDGSEIATESKPVKKDRTVDWPRYGYDTERTKFLDAQRVRPPFRKLWKYDQDELIEFAPVLSGGRMYLIDNAGTFITLNNDTGKVVWKKRLGELNASSPAIWRDLLVAVNLNPPQALGIRSRDGKVMWNRDLPSRSESSPMVVGKNMYFGTESGEFFALDPSNGKVRWQQTLDGEVKAAPAYTDGTLYVGDYAGQFYALRASDGKIVWKTSDLGAGLGRGGRFYSTPAVAFGRVYVGNVDGRVYSFDRQTGEIAWTHSAGDYVYSGVAAAETDKTKPAVYAGSHDHTVYSLDAKNGSVNWQAPPGGQVSGPATVIGDVVYVSTFSGNATVGFDLGTGRRVFKFGEGQYGPAVSDGERLFVLGGSEVIAYKPIKIGKYEPKNGTKGIVPLAELAKIRAKEKRAREGGGSGANGAQESGTGKKSKSGGGKKKAGGKKSGKGGSKKKGKKKSGG